MFIHFRRKRIFSAYAVLMLCVTFVFWLIYMLFTTLSQMNAYNMDTAVEIMFEDLDNIEARLGSNLKAGGVYIPPNSTFISRVAILVPYRDRAEHLRVFLNHMHPFLQKQNIMYGIFVVEMDHSSQFNRGLLMNIGFIEAMKHYNFACIVLHDVDLLPEDYRIPYTCPHLPTHLSGYTSQFHYRLPYNKYFGGVSAISSEHYKKINGMSNIFFGWGGEDDDLYLRILHHNFVVIRPAADIARYRMLKHKPDEDKNPNRACLLSSAGNRSSIDGLNSAKYTVLAKEQKPLYTWMLIKANALAIKEANANFHTFYQECIKYHQQIRVDLFGHKFAFRSPFL